MRFLPPLHEDNIDGSRAAAVMAATRDVGMLAAVNPAPAEAVAVGVPRERAESVESPVLGDGYAGSASGTEKWTGGNTGTALRADSTGTPRQDMANMSLTFTRAHIRVL